jgi:hypothetical protein
MQFGCLWIDLARLLHFIPICTTDSTSDLTPIYTREIVRLHGVLRLLPLIGMLSLYRSSGRV